MKTVGLVVEYNPLHNGHYYHCQQSRYVTGADAVVAVMSGSFLQRGEPALVNKWARTEMALRMGADVVLELPVAFSAQPAEWFAFGAVSALQRTGVVDCFCFGSESGDIRQLEAAAERLYAADRYGPDPGPHSESSALHTAIRERLKAGANYPSAYAAAAAELLGNEREQDWLSLPNNTLGLHYLLALLRMGGTMRPYTITRRNADYRQTDITDERIASATALRTRLLEAGGQLDAIRPYVPSFTADILEREFAAGRGPVSWDSYIRSLITQLTVQSTEQLAEHCEMTEGLEHRVKRMLPLVSPDRGMAFEQLIQALKTKRYTRTKLQRAMTRVLLNHRKSELAPERLREGVPYLRVLGFSERGRELLRRMRKSADVPVITKAASFRHPYLDMDIRAGTIHALGYRSPASTDLYRDYYEMPLRFDCDSPSDHLDGFAGNPSK